MIDFLKVRNVKDPVWNFEENAGIDFFVPEKDDAVVAEIMEFNEKHGNNVTIDGNTITVPAHEDILIPAGIKSKFPKNVGLMANNKSGVATKKKFIFGAELIDTSYQGEWHIHLINTSNKPQTLDFGTKCVQFVPVMLYVEGCTITTKADGFFTEETNRGEGGFGSTGI